MADLDLLREINNTYGHLAGDAVIQGIADIFRSELRQYDIASRFGGEEFSLLLPETDRETAFEIAERIRRKVAAAGLRVGDDDRPDPRHDLDGRGDVPAGRHGREGARPRRPTSPSTRPRSEGRNRVVAADPEHADMPRRARAHGRRAARARGCRRAPAPPAPARRRARAGTNRRARRGGTGGAIAPRTPEKAAGAGQEPDRHLLSALGLLVAAVGVARRRRGGGRAALRHRLRLPRARRHGRARRGRTGALVRARRLRRGDLRRRGRLARRRGDLRLPRRAAARARGRNRRLERCDGRRSSASSTTSRRCRAPRSPQPPCSRSRSEAGRSEGSPRPVSGFVAGRRLLRRRTWPWSASRRRSSGGRVPGRSSRSASPGSCLTTSCTASSVRVIADAYRRVHGLRARRLRPAAAADAQDAGGVHLAHARLDGEAAGGVRHDQAQNVSLERANQLLRERTTAAMESLSATVDARDAYTAGHSRRVQQLSLAIGSDLGLSDPELDLLGHAALFHDIGKLAVPDADPAQARQPHPRRAAGSCRATPRRAPASSAASASSRTRSRRSATTTSAGTATATRTDSQAKRSRSARASSTSPTRSTRC